MTMLDDLREQSDEFDYSGENNDVFEYDSPGGQSARPGMWLGMTPIQRFVIAVMLLMMTCILSTFCLLVTERIAPPFL